MKITVLGSSSGMPVTDRHQSAYLVETDRDAYLIDCGEGASGQLIKFRADPNRIRAVFISHTHPDHVSGLFMLLQWMHLEKRTDPLVVFLPGDRIADFETMMPCFQIIREKWAFDFTFHPVDEGPVWKKDNLWLMAIANGHLRAYRSLNSRPDRHANSFSFIFSEKNGGGIVYTSDVDSLNHLKAAYRKPGMQPVSALISECTHIPVSEIADLILSTGISRVVISHIPPDLNKDEAVAQLPENITVDFAFDGFVIEV